MPTKPEGPAQERECTCMHFADGYVHYDVCCPVPLTDHPLPATPAPSQPAGARELIRYALITNANGSPEAFKWEHGGWVKYEDAIAFAAQQTAAKDARIQEQHERAERAIEVSLREKHLREAAERERDSLREALTVVMPLFKELVDEYHGIDRNANCHICQAVTKGDAALKAGKGQQ